MQMNCKIVKQFRFAIIYPQL